MRTVGLHISSESHMSKKTTYLVNEHFFSTLRGVQIPPSDGHENRHYREDICICLSERYPKLAKEIANENYTGLRLFCKLQGWELVKKIFIT